MANKMKNCKICGQEVVPSAKVCPSCGWKLKMGLGKKSLIGVGALVLLRIIKSVLKRGSTSAPKTATPSPSSISSISILPELVAAALPANELPTSNLNIKVLEVTAPDYTDRDTVKAYPPGSWVVVKISIQNNQKDAINVTSSNYKLLDKDKRQFTISMGETVGLEMTGKITLPFRIKPVNTLEGYLAYDVPKSLAGFTIEDSECVTGTPTKLIRQ